MRALTLAIKINATQQRVWETLADFGTVSDWAPYMKNSHLIGEIRSAEGMRRGMLHAWGFRFEETVTAWNEGEGFSFDVDQAPFPMKDVRESWSIGHQDGFSTVTTSVTYGMKMGLIGTVLDWLFVRFVVQREMRAGLNGLKEHLEHR
jgi:hypothetical protein